MSKTRTLKTRTVKPAKLPASDKTKAGEPVLLRRIVVPQECIKSNVVRPPQRMPQTENVLNVRRSIERYWIEMIELHRSARAVLPIEDWKTLITLFDHGILMHKYSAQEIDTAGVNPTKKGRPDDDEDEDDGTVLPDSDYRFPTNVPATPARKPKAPAAAAPAASNGHTGNGKVNGATA